MSASARAGLGGISRRSVRRGLVVAAVVVAAVVGVVFAIRAVGARPVEVCPVSNLGYGYGGTGGVQGQVSEGRVQRVALRQGEVTGIAVSEGQRVSKGDVLLTYDTTSFEVTLMKDEADIASYEAQIAQDEKEARRLAWLRPSEETPPPVTKTVDHGALPVLDALDGVPEADKTYYVWVDDAATGSDEGATVGAGFLKSLRDSGEAVSLVLCADAGKGDVTLLGTVELDGSELAGLEPEYVYEPYVPGEASSEVGGAQGTGEAGQGTSPTLYTRALRDPLDAGWRLGDAFSCDEDGKLVVRKGARLLGTLRAQAPKTYRRYDTVEVEVPGTDAEDYLYSRAELASKISDARKDAREVELSLRQARLTYEQDKLTAESGQVVAAIDGVVSAVGDPSALRVGDTVVEVRGEEDCLVTLYVGEDSLGEVRVGDAYDVSTWQSGQGFEAKVAEVGSTPVEGSWSLDDANPNTSWYPVTCVAVGLDDGVAASLEVGEGCEAFRAADPDQGPTDSLYLPKMYVRRDKDGAYVMAKGADGRLERRAVGCGRTLWGDEVEITYGLAADDRVAFPYGSDVVPGARTVDADYPSE